MDNKLMKVMMLLVVFGLVCSAGSLVYAETQGGGAESREAGYQKDESKGFFKGIDLTAEQKEKLKVHREAQKASALAVKEQLKVKMQALHAELGKPVTDRAQLNTLVTEINALKGQMFSQRIDGILGMKGILTPEQFATVQARFAERRAQHGKKGEHGWKQEHKDKDAEGEDPKE